MANPPFPPPTGAQIVRALRAPAIGYAWLLLGAVATMLLIVVAANIGSTGSETGVESDDTNALGVLLGMPFQIAAMALLGSLGFTEDGVAASLFLPPLLLTGLYLVMTARSARRGELVLAAGTRAMLAVVVGLAGAAVITPATWALAMRAEGVAVHAASVNLFFGVWALTAVATYVGSSRAVDATRPAWVPADYAAGARLWAGSVLVWLAVAVPVLTVVFAVKEDLWVAVLSPIWGPTVGIDAYAVAHLGRLSFVGETAGLGDVGTTWAILLVVAAVTLAGLSSIAWHLRRDARVETLAQPGSWVTLPASYAVGGLAVWLVPSVVVGGGISGVGASAVLQPAFWVLFVLTAWGLVVEVASRYVAPSLAPALPPRVHALLRGPERVVEPAEGAHPGSAASAEPPRPLTPEERARYKRLGITAGALAVLALAGWITVSVVNSRLYSPEQQAETYLDALVDGDVDSVVDLSRVDDDIADDDLLTSEIYLAAENRVTGYEIGDVDEDGDTVTIEVELQGPTGGTDAELVIEKDGTTNVVFDNWRVTEGGLARAVSLYIPDTAGDLTVNGVDVDRIDDSVWLLPADYVFDAFAGNPWLESPNDPVTVAVDEDYQSFDAPSATASDAFREEVQSQVDAYLAECMAATELEPEGCPNSAYEYGDVRNVVWTLDQAPTPDFEYFDGEFPADLSYGESGQATVTYEVDESFGYGKPDWQPQTDTSDLYLSSIKVTGDGEGLVVTIDD